MPCICHVQFPNPKSYPRTMFASYLYLLKNHAAQQFAWYLPTQYMRSVLRTDKKKNTLKAKFNYSKYSVWLQAKQVECDPVLHTTNCWSPYSKGSSLTCFHSNNTFVNYLVALRLWISWRQPLTWFLCSVSGPSPLPPYHPRELKEKVAMTWEHMLHECVTLPRLHYTSCMMKAANWLALSQPRSWADEHCYHTTWREWHNSRNALTDASSTTAEISNIQSDLSDPIGNMHHSDCSIFLWRCDC